MLLHIMRCIIFYIYKKKIKICIYLFIFKVSFLLFYVKVNNFNNKSTIIYLLNEERIFNLPYLFEQYQRRFVFAKKNVPVAIQNQKFQLSGISSRFTNPSFGTQSWKERSSLVLSKYPKVWTNAGIELGTYNPNVTIILCERWQSTGNLRTCIR